MSIFATSVAKMRIPAVVKVSRADACGVHLSRTCKGVSSYYQHLPYAPDTGAYSCLRIHQVLYNEVVTITRELPGGEVAVEIPGVFYLDKHKRKRNDFWMLKRDLIPLRRLSQDVQKQLPPPIDYKKPVAAYTENVLTLSVPWCHEKTKQIYSVGTRFIRDTEHDTEDAYAVKFFDPQKRTSVCALIPKSSALVTYYRAFNRARRVFMSLLRGWAHQTQGFIPYVYGGSSFTEPCFERAFTKVVSKKCAVKASYWVRKGCKIVPKSGFDCSNMILRAAQMAGLPYYFKNTHALTRFLHPLKKGEQIEEGDLVWYSGHVMIVSDLKKNLLIEAIGYDSGFGRVHEIPLNKVFSGMRNFIQLQRAYHSNRFMHRLNSSGKPWRSVYHIKILKLRSIQNIRFY